MRKLKWKPGGVIPRRWPAGTYLDFRDFAEATAAHGRPFGPFEGGRVTEYDRMLPQPPKRRWPDDVPF